MGGEKTRGYRVVISTVDEMGRPAVRPQREVQPAPRRRFICGQEASISAERPPVRLARAHGHVIGQSREEHLQCAMGAPEKAAAVQVGGGTPGDELQDLLLATINSFNHQPRFGRAGDVAPEGLATLKAGHARVHQQ
jgi:hypothetical protein